MRAKTRASNVWPALGGPGCGLDESAAETLKTRRRFRPALLNGQPVNVSAGVEMSFRFDQAGSEHLQKSARKATLSA